MAHHKSALKRIRQNKVQYARNKAFRTRVRTVLKRVRVAIADKDIETAKTAYNELVPIVDSMATRRIIHRNKAARYKSRLNKQIATLATE